MVSPMNRQGGENSSRRELVEAVEEGTSFKPVEQETLILFSKIDDRASVDTVEAAIVRRLLRYPSFEIDSLYVSTDDVVGRRVAPNDFEQGAIVGVNGNIPVEALVLQRSLRETSQHSALVPEGVLRAEATAD